MVFGVNGVRIYLADVDPEVVCNMFRADSRLFSMVLRLIAIVVVVDDVVIIGYLWQ